ncbi:hypothetical protein [Mesorhizobium sp. LCM 4576]|nr:MULTISPECIES: hypothetical protein [unclassified Mesorhizobium]
MHELGARTVHLERAAPKSRLPKLRFLAQDREEPGFPRGQVLATVYARA